MFARRSFVCLLCCGLAALVGGCSRDSKQPTASASAPASALPVAAASASKPEPQGEIWQPSVAAEDESAEAEPEASVATLGANDHPRWLLDDAVDIGPAAPVSACTRGAVFVTTSDELRLAKLGKLGRGDKPTHTPVAPLPSSRDDFTLARGPAVAGEDVYWISGRQLLHRSLQGAHGSAQPLANDAVPGTRVAVPTAGGPQLPTLPRALAYIARSAEGPPRRVAKLWIEGHAPLLLTPDGAAASSVGLVRDAQGLVAWSIEGRTGMTPVHSRAIRFGKAGPELQEDRVVWVGGASQPFTELIPLGAKDQQQRVALPLERDVTRFGLLQLSLEREQSQARSRWALYPNGLDPAPVAGGSLCGEQVVAVVMPQSAQGATPQRLEIISAEDNTTPALVASFAQRFFDVSLQSLGDAGALLVSVADRRTWAVTVRCRSN